MGIHLRSFLYFWLGDMQKSIQDLDEEYKLWHLLEFHRHLIVVDIHRAFYFFGTGDFEKSRKIRIQSSVDFEDKFQSQVSALSRIELLIFLGFVDLKEEKIESAEIKSIEVKALLSKLDPSIKTLWSDFHDLLNGEIFLEKGEFEKAIETLNRITQIPLSLSSPYNTNVAHYHFPFLRDILARAYHKNGELDKAIAEYEKLTSVNPVNRMRYFIHPLYHYRLAKLYEEKGQKNEAINKYGKFIRIYKDTDKMSRRVIETKEVLNRLKDSL